MSNVGGVIRLTCGGIGTGKSYLNVKLALDEIKKGNYKRIYSNIRGHADLSDGQILQMPDDWRDCEPDSLIIFDEIQMHEKFSKHFSARRDGEIASISMIRHKRIDLWLISPNPALVNSDIRNLVNQYYWLEIQSKKVTKAWCFTKVYNNVTKTIKNQAYDEFTYSIEEKYYKLYLSTEDGKPSGRNAIINMKLIMFIVGMIITVLMIIGMIYFLTGSTKSEIDKAQNKEKATEQATNQVSVNPVLSMNNHSMQPLDKNNLAIECARAENYANPQCIEYLRNQNNVGHNMTNEMIQYDVSKPYSVENHQYQYQIQQKPYLIGCMSDNKSCHCYTQQGTKIKLAYKDCKRYIAGDKPFDPVKPMAQSNIGAMGGYSQDMQTMPSVQNNVNQGNNQQSSDKQGNMINAVNHQTEQANLTGITAVN